ncbi:MAG: hypothetical protein NVSMB70_06140 [Chamaesiphon sp.]
MFHPGGKMRTIQFMRESGLINPQISLYARKMWPEMTKIR